jgi:chorismate mutase
MNIQALRGATTVEKNTPQEIITKTKVLLTTIIDKNQLSYDEIISIIFTATKDIDTQYPAVAARELGMTAIPLLCCQEMHVQGSLSRCIRVLL